MTPILTALTFSMGAHQSLFARHFLAADQQARERGVTLAVSEDFRALKALNAAHRDSWYSLPAMYDPDVNDLSGAFWLAALDGDGTVLATHACRPFDIEPGGLVTLLGGLRLFYDHPEASAQPAEAVALSIPAQQAPIEGPTSYMGGVWVRPGARGRYLPRLMADTCCAIALTRGARICWGLSTEHRDGSGLYCDYGCEHLMGTVYLLGSPIAPYKRMALMWRTDVEIIASMQEQRRAATRLRVA